MLMRVKGDRHIGWALPVAAMRWLSWTAAALALCGAARGQVTLRDQGFVPFRDEPINYLSDRVNDPVARLQQRIDRDGVALEFNPKNGYLESVLKYLQVPVSSQTLVFSKTSFQYKKISPSTPRALYFNDNVYVGWVPNGHSLEIASFDPSQGAIFYLLDQQATDQPAFVRATLDCTQCHVAPGTRGVPGVLLRSIFARPSGTQAIETESFIVGHETPLKDRFGGWYVTGTHGRQLHMGNAFVEDTSHPDRLDRAAGANIKDLTQRFPTGEYLSAHSDIVAHLVLAHQTQMHNLITVLNYKTRLAAHADQANARSGGRSDGAISKATLHEIEGPAEELLRYLLFVDETLLESPIEGTSRFRDEFTATGPRDPLGRSLRDFDLKRRIFKYSCSYLIYSDAFDALPEPAKEYIYKRLFEVLSGRDQSVEYARLSPGERRDILEILLATKPGLAGEWKRSGITPSTK
jgi:hypothetical protein